VVPRETLPIDFLGVRTGKWKKKWLVLSPPRHHRPATNSPKFTRHRFAANNALPRTQSIAEKDIIAQTILPLKTPYPKKQYRRKVERKPDHQVANRYFI
jgi:hypothetical protein